MTFPYLAYYIGFLFLVLGVILGGAACILKVLQFKRDAALYKLVSLSSVGGYYIWRREGNYKEVSPSLTSMLMMRLPNFDLNDIAELFPKEKETILGEFKKLKNGALESTHISAVANLSECNKDIQIIGSTVLDKKTLQVNSVILWFYDLTSYTSQIRHFSSQNNMLTKEVREYSGIFNTIPIPIWKRGSDYKIQFCNLIYSQFVKGENDNLSSHEIAELDQSLHDLSILARSNNRPLRMKKHMVVQGERRFYNITEMLIKNSEETIGFAYDITDQDEIEKELARHISAHADLLESSSSAIAVYGPDTKIKFYNNAFVNLWGLKIKWLDTNPTYGEILEVLREKRTLPEQADFKQFRKEQMMLFHDVTKTHEDIMHLPNGKSIRIIVIPHALGGLLFAYEDVTDRLAMETSFNTLIAVQRETLDNLSEGVVLIGENGKIKLYNPVYVRMWLEDEEYLDTKPRFADLMERAKSFYNYGNDWDRFKDSLILDILGRKYSVRRESLTNKHAIDIISRPLPNGDTLVSFVDVTSSLLVEQTLLEKNEALIEADRLKTEFLANISYELRTPLTSIIGFSEALQTEMFGKLNAQQMEYVKGVQDSSTELLSLINDVLDLASIEAGYMSLDLKQVDVYAVLSGIAKLLKARAKATKIYIKLSCDRKIGVINADESRIKQVIFKLISNSMKFTEVGGAITLGATAVGKSKINIWVEDTGIGVAQEDKQKVFERFFKSASAKFSKKSGAGLGLSVVKNIIELHGGSVVLESVEGKGTKVILTLSRKGPKFNKKINKIKSK